MMRTAILAASLSVMQAAEPAPFQWRGRVPAGGLIEIKGINANVFAEPSEGSDIEVVAVTNGVERHDLRVEMVRHDKGVTVCAVSKGGKCIAGETNDAGAAASARVDFTVRVPRGVGLVGRVVTGGVEADRLESDVEAYIVNGRVSVSTAGSLVARAINGSIFAALRDSKEMKPSRLSTVNGGIIVKLPGVIDASVSAEAENGEVSANFPLQAMGRGRSGRIGAGRRQIQMKTVNGSIELRKAS